MKIGIIDLDTSHPASWIPIERELGHEIVGVFDAGAVHPPGYAAKFAAEHNIPRVFESVEAMVSHVDCAIIHSCDWDRHIAKARPFIAERKAVLIDKPLAGNARDLAQLKTWAASGARITGGSSLRFCYETQNFLCKPLADRGTPHTVFCGCGVDELNYGIHAYSMLAGILGTGAASVRSLGAGLQRRVQIRYPDGRCGIVLVGQTAAWMPFYASIITERSATQFIADTTKLYRAQLEALLPFLAGQTDTQPMTPDEWIEPELCALAAQKSWQNGDREVSLCEFSDADSYDGAAFAEFYRKSRYPNGAVQ